jgi:chloramphenicol-sensitive protein RarD
LKPNTSTLAAVSAFVIWGFIAIPLKLLAAYPSPQLLYYRISLALLCLPVLLLLFKRQAIRSTFTLYSNSSVPDRRKTILAILGGSLLLTANWLLFIYVVNHVSLQTASFSYLLCPILTAFLGFLILKEHLRPQQWLAIAISLLSCCLIGVDSLTNLMYSLLVAFSYALYLISQRYIKGYDKMVLLTVQIFLAFTVIFSLGEGFRGTPPDSFQFYAIVFILSTVFTILPLFLNLFALKELKSATIGILMYINPMVSFLVAFVYFNEQASLVQFLAYTLIFFSVLLYNINTDRLSSAGSLFRKSKART